MEVFRLTPEIDKYYETALYTSIFGKFPNEIYYTTYPLVYVGKFIKHVSIGYRDNAEHWDVFDKDGEEVLVKYTYEGTTCFRECTYRGVIAK
jgi:hypothetical protein